MLPDGDTLKLRTVSGYKHDHEGNLTGSTNPNHYSIPKCIKLHSLMVALEILRLTRLLQQYTPSMMIRATNTY